MTATDPHTSRQRFSVQDCDHYLDHLAALGDFGIVVTASDDIVSEYGVVVLPRFTAFTRPVAEAWRGRSLQRPIDALFEVRPRLNTATLVGCFHELLDAAPDLTAVNTQCGFDERLRHLCHTVELPAAAMQKLTVMRSALPRVFERSIFAAWFATLIAVERKLGATDIALAFQGGLYHDLGLLHIDPALVDKKADIQPDEWRAIQSHVWISAEIAASERPADRRLIAVIAQHHERCDGAGYPTGKAGTELEPVAAIIALADMVDALRFHSRRAVTQTLADCMPYLRVNLRTFGEANCKAAERVILSTQRSTPQESRSPRGFKLEDLTAANRALQDMLAMFREARPLLEAIPEQRISSSLISLMEQIQWVALHSGMGSEVLESWLRETIDDATAGAAMDEVYQTAKEVFWLVVRIDRQLQALIAAHADVAEPITQLAATVAGELARGRQLFEAAG